MSHVQRLEGQLQSLIQNSRNNIASHQSEETSSIQENEIQLLRCKVTDLDKKVIELQLERENLQGSLRDEVRSGIDRYYCSYFYEFSHFYNLCKNKKCASKKSD